MSKRRVAVTGISAVSSVGVGAEENWKALVAGKSGISKITRFDPSGFRVDFAGEVKNFNPEKYLDAKQIRMMDPFIWYAMAAAEEAFMQSGLIQSPGPIPEELSYRAGSIMGCGLGGLPEIEEAKQNLIEKGVRRISPFFIPKVISNLAVGHIAIKYGLRGVSYVATSACSSGAHAIGESFRMIRDGYLDLAVTGGTESTISPLCIGGFSSMKALSTRNETPEQASRPFDKDRDGFVVGEGAGVMILEEWEAAKKRGANILGELVGYAASCDAYHMTAPTEDGSGPAAAMSMALQDAKITEDKILSINAHATSTGLGDIAETQAIKKVFKDHTQKIKVTSTKSMIGHTLGAAGGIEAVYTLMSLKNQIVLPTINLDNQDPDCDLNVAANEAVDLAHEYAMSNSFGFGGTNASLILRRV